MKSIFSAVIAAALLLCLSLTGFTRQTAKVEYKTGELKVGDKVPDLKLINLINHPTKTARLSDFKGKAIILDLWTQGCVSCVASWPKLQALQKEFEGKLQIILINPRESEAIVTGLVEKRRKAGVVDLTLPVVCKDLSIKEIFPHTTVPHVIWINKNGIIESITAASLTSKNVQALVDGSKLKLPQKVKYEDVDFSKPLAFLADEEMSQSALVQSILTRQTNLLRSAYGFTIDSGSSVMNVSNLYIKDLYRCAYSDSYKGAWTNLELFPDNRTILEVKDPALYGRGVKDEDEKENQYVYQLFTRRMVPVPDLQKMMQADLSRYFGLPVRFEKRKMKCFVLTAADTSLINDNGSGFSSVVSDAEINVYGINTSGFIKNLESLSYYATSPHPIVDETGFTGRLRRMQFEINVNDPVVLDKALQQFGMRFTLQDRTVEVLVISEPKDYVLPHLAYVPKPAKTKLYTHPLPEAVLLRIMDDDVKALDPYLSKDKINECYHEGYGYTLLSLSIKVGAKKCFDLLLSKGANVEKTCEYKTPLMYAAKAKNMEMVKALIKAGANPNAVNSENENVMHYAKKYQFQEMIDYLNALKK
jgi:thiol-disulfide isomerase/thioredoxin